MAKKFEEEIKKQAIQLYEAGQPVSLIAEKFDLSESTLYRWIREQRLIQSNEFKFTLSEFYALSRKVKHSEHQLQIIQQTGLIEEIPLRKRLEILADLHEREQYSVHELCDALNVSRGTFYNHIFRRADRTQYLREQKELMIQVQQIFDDSEQRFGAEKIRVILAENGVHVSKKRIAEIMKELDLHSVRPDAKKTYKKQQGYQMKNVLKRNFSSDKPNQTWVSDITYFKINDYGVYFCVILDLFSRKVVGYAISKNQSTHLVTSAFKRAFEERGRPSNLTFHSDRGGQYTSGAFTKLLRQYHVSQSFSASGKPHDNAVAETFFATFKKEEAYRRNYTSEKDYCKSVERYIKFYNEKRPHQSNAYKTPLRFEELFGREQKPIL